MAITQPITVHTAPMPEVPQPRRSVDSSGVQAAIDLALEHGRQDADDLAPNLRGQHVAAGNDYQIVDLQPYADAPRRAAGIVQLVTTDSLVTYLHRHTRPEAINGSVDDQRCSLYVDLPNFTAITVLNDHSYDGPGWRDDRATLKWQPTPGWQRWAGVDRKMLQQDEFSELIEDGLTEIATPSGADLLELAQSIRATTSANFRSDRRLQNGRVQLTYVEEVDARAGADGQMEIPADITLVLAPFQGAEPVTVKARLRYRVTGGKLTLGIILNNPDIVLADAVDRELSLIRSVHPHVMVVLGRP
jgi:uncharacterized protein YfdQ (DUF2303 family)